MRDDIEDIAVVEGNTLAKTISIVNSVSAETGRRSIGIVINGETALMDQIQYLAFMTKMIDTAEATFWPVDVG